MSKNKNRVTLPKWVASPPLTPIVTLSSLALTPPWNYTVTRTDRDVRQEFDDLLRKPMPADIETRPFGNLKDLLDVHRNVAHAVLLERILRDLLRHLHSRRVALDPFARLIVATKLVGVGASIVTTCHVLYMHDSAFALATALGQLRIGIELVARSAWVALGTGCEPQQLFDGPRLPTREERRAAQPQATHCMKTIAPRAAQRWRGSDSPVDVYEWLCRYTHFDSTVVDEIHEGKPTAETVYAATAYVAWLAAVVAEIVMGQEFATPPNLPDPPPWRPLA